MDSDAVREQIQGGKTLREIAGDSADELVAGMLDLVGTRLDAAVKDGRITQAQAEETLSRAKARADAWLAGEDTGMMGRGLGLGLLFGPGMGPDEGVGPGAGMGPGMRGGTADWPAMWDDDDADEPGSSGGTSSSSATSSTAWRT